MKKLLALALLVILMTGAVKVSADGGYGSQPGYPVANGNTDCAGHGSFGAFGAHGDILHDFGHVGPNDSNGKPGANGALTGANNSGLCGNPQNP